MVQEFRPTKTVQEILVESSASGWLRQNPDSQQVAQVLHLYGVTSALVLQLLNILNIF